MVHLFVSISRFTLIIMFAIYTYDCFAALKRKTSEKRQNRIYHRQNGILYLMLLNANAVLFAVTMDFRILVLLGAEMVFSRLRWLSTAISTGMPPVSWSTTCACCWPSGSSF